MSRISHAVRGRYRLKVQPGHSESECYFCGQGAGMEDFTPSTSAFQQDLDRFIGEYVRVKACSKCWRRIYTVNIAEYARRFNVPRGCMTLEQKESLLTGKPYTRAFESAGKYSFSFDPPIIAPLGLQDMGDHKFVWKTQTVYAEEIQVLQGGMALAMVNARRPLIELFLLSVILSEDLDSNRLDIYRDILGLPSQQEMIDEEVNRADSH